MKHVYSNHEIPHLWAHQSQDSARNGNGSFYFEGTTIYSYGSHFPIARWVHGAQGEQAVLVTTRHYSVTTTQHVSRVRSAIPYGTRMFFVHDPDYEPCDVFASEFPADIRDNLERAASANKRNRPKYLDAALSVRARAVEFAEFFGLDASTLPAIPQESEVKAVVDAWREQERIAAEQRQARIKAELKREAAEALKRFFEGDSTWYARYPDGSAALRIDGEEIVTSLGARVPLDHARRGLAIVRAVVARGTEYVSNGHTIHLGHYPIDRIEKDGTLHAGCHVIRYAEIERIAPELEKRAATVA